MFGILFQEIGKIFDEWFPEPEPIKPVIVKKPQLTETGDFVSKPLNVSDLSDLEVVARTIWGEARNQNLTGMTAVGCVIQNRAHIDGWFGTTPREVCLKPYQFSCWGRNDPNRALMLSVTTADRQYQVAISIANSVLTGTLNDITNNADSYEVKGTNAFWARNLEPVASIGVHEFYVTRQA